MATEKTTKKAPKKAVKKAAPSKAAKAPKKAPKKAEKSNPDAFFVIATGGKQYKVSSGDTIKIEKIEGLKMGDKVVFDQVLFTFDGDDAKIGTPGVPNMKVEGEVVEEGRNKKVTVIKYKQKSRYFKERGHRQPFIKVKIK